MGSLDSYGNKILLLCRTCRAGNPHDQLDLARLLHSVRAPPGGGTGSLGGGRSSRKQDRLGARWQQQQQQWEPDNQGEAFAGLPLLHPHLPGLEAAASRLPAQQQQQQQHDLRLAPPPVAAVRTRCALASLQVADRQQQALLERGWASQQPIRAQAVSQPGHIVPGGAQGSHGSSSSGSSSAAHACRAWLQEVEAVAADPRGLGRTTMREDALLLQQQLKLRARSSVLSVGRGRRMLSNNELVAVRARLERKALLRCVAGLLGAGL